MKSRKKLKKKSKKSSRKQERRAKIANLKRITPQSLKRKRRPKINWTKIHYINISFIKTNLFINFQEIHGLSLRWTSAGMHGFKRRARNKYPSLFLQTTKFLQKVGYRGNVYPFLVWNGLPRRYYRTIIKSMRYANRWFKKLSWRGTYVKTHIPFNGCRRKKLKRR